MWEPDARTIGRWRAAGLPGSGPFSRPQARPPPEWPRAALPEPHGRAATRLGRGLLQVREGAGRGARGGGLRTAQAGSPLPSGAQTTVKGGRVQRPCRRRRVRAAVGSSGRSTRPAEAQSAWDVGAKGRRVGQQGRGLLLPQPEGRRAAPRAPPRCPKPRRADRGRTPGESRNAGCRYIPHGAGPATVQSVGAAQAAKRDFSRQALPGRSAVPTGAGQPGRTEVSHRAPGRQGAGFIQSPASGTVAA